MLEGLLFNQYKNGTVIPMDNYSVNTPPQAAPSANTFIGLLQVKGRLRSQPIRLNMENILFLDKVVLDFLK